VIALLVVIGGVWGFSTLSDSGSSGGQEPAPVAVDSAELKKERQKIEEQEKQKQDSLQKHVQDSLNKLKQKNRTLKKTEPKKVEPKKPEPKKEEPKTTRVRG
jgi:uncharacterized protein YcbK (DUF882 family)